MKSRSKLFSHLAGNKLEISRALSITVASSIGCSRLVGRVLCKTTIGIHLDKVQGTVDTTTWIKSASVSVKLSISGRLTQARNINIESELLVLQLEQLVLVAVDQVDTRSDVVALLELQADRVAAGLDTVSTRVVWTKMWSVCDIQKTFDRCLPAPSRAQLAAHCTLLGQRVLSNLLPV